MFATAVDDGRIKRNPCRIKGADQHRTPERPHASIDEVYRLADLMPKRFRLLVLLAAFSGLRWGELIALQRRDIDVATMLVRVSRRVAQAQDGQMTIGPTKSAAGVRTVPLPRFLGDELTAHLSEFTEPGRDGVLFVGKRGECCGGATSIGGPGGRPPWSRRACRRASTSMTCVTRVTRWRRRPGPPLVS